MFKSQEPGFKRVLAVWFGAFLFAGTIACLCAAPPAVEFPQETKAVGDYVRVSPKTDAKTVIYIGLSGVDPFPNDALKDGKTFILPVRGLAEGKYMFKGIATLNDEPTTFDFWVIIGEGKNDDKTKPVPPVPPKPNPDVQKVDSAFVVVVEDANAIRTLDTARMLGDPYWQTLKPKNDWRHYRSDSQTAKDNNYVAEAEKTEVGYPAAILIDPKTMKVLTSFKATGIDSIKEAVNKWVK